MLDMNIFLETVFKKITVKLWFSKIIQILSMQKL